MRDLTRELEAIAARLGAETATIHLLEGGVLRLRAVMGLPASVVAIVKVVPIGKGIVGLAVQRNAPVSNSVGPKRSGIAGAVAVPIRDARGRARGALGIGVHREHTYTREEIGALEKAAQSLDDLDGGSELTAADLRAALHSFPQGAAFAQTMPAAHHRDFLRTFASASRMFRVTPGLRLATSTLTPSERFEAWSLCDLARAVMLATAAEQLSSAELTDLLSRLYHGGDTREREAVLRTLPFVPSNDQLVRLAIDACRSHVQTVFEAIACDNPFPADRFPEAAFNQMVLKCIFTGAELDRVLGLARRRTPELARMARAYESERRAASRPVPADLARIT